MTLTWITPDRICRAGKITFNSSTHVLWSEQYIYAQNCNHLGHYFRLIERFHLTLTCHTKRRKGLIQMNHFCQYVWYMYAIFYVCEDLTILQPYKNHSVCKIKRCIDVSHWLRVWEKIKITLTNSGVFAKHDEEE